MKNLGQKFIVVILVAFCASIISSLTSFAEPASLGRERAWEAVNDTDRNMCYMISFPLRSEGDYTSRDPVYLTISNRTNDNVTGEIAFYAGYPYGTQPVTFTIGSKSFDLTPKGEWAWTNNAEQDKAVLDAMISGSSLVVKGYSSRGTLTTDTFSLSGVTASWNKIKGGCPQ